MESGGLVSELGVDIGGKGEKVPRRWQDGENWSRGLTLRLSCLSQLSRESVYSPSLGSVRGKRWYPSSGTGEEIWV